MTIVFGGFMRTNGFSAVADIGEIAFDINFVRTPDGKVGTEEGSQARTYPSIAAYSYSMDADGTVTTKEIFRQDERSPDDLKKPKEPLPIVKPQ